LTFRTKRVLPVQNHVLFRAAASYQPYKTLVVREDNAGNPGRYVLNGRGHVVNKAGEIVQTAIKPGTRVRVYYANMGDLRMIDHVVVVD